jgi:hypothetical protein
VRARSGSGGAGRAPASGEGDATATVARPDQTATVTKLARDFRAALVRVSKRGGVLFGAFPRGACGNASEMFAYHLWTTQQIAAALVSAEMKRGRFQSHAWIELDGLIVDLTIDQFSTWHGDVPHIGPRTAWHTRWKIVSRNVITAYDPAQLLRSWGGAYDDVFRAVLAPDAKQVVVPLPTRRRSRRS